MAKDGGGAHYDERLREAGYYDRPRRKKARRAASTGYADSPEVLSAITKPRKKPVVVVKKKKTIPIPQAKPSRVQTDSDSGDVYEPTRMVTTRYNVGGNLRSGAKAADARDQSFKLRTVADYLKRRLSPQPETPSFGGPTPDFGQVPGSANAADRGSNLRRLTDVVRRKRLKIGRSGATGLGLY